MKKSTKIALIALILPLAGCAGNPARFVIDAPAGTKPVPLRVSGIEMRDVVLPAYAAESEILQEQSDGSLKALKGAVWADGSAQAVTAELARSIALQSTASVAPEPWPLTRPADARVETRIDRMVARQDGRFELGGQYAVAAPDGALREFIQRFDIRVPLAGNTAPDIAAAYGKALQELSRQITGKLAR